MYNILIYRHKKTDTESVNAAINLSYIKNKQGFKTAPYVRGNINNETKFVLNYFNIAEPKYLNDVKLQIKDLNYEKNYELSVDKSIYRSYIYMKDKEISTLPIVNENKKFLGAVSMKEIVKYLVDSDEMELHR